MTNNELTQAMRRFAVRAPDVEMDARILAALRRTVPCADSCGARAPFSPWLRWACLSPALIAAGVVLAILLSQRAGCHRAAPPQEHHGTSAFFESICTTTTHGTFLDSKPHASAPATPPPKSAVPAQPVSVCMAFEPYNDARLTSCNLWMQAATTGSLI